MEKLTNKEKAILTYEAIRKAKIKKLKKANTDYYAASFNSMEHYTRKKLGQF